MPIYIGIKTYSWFQKIGVFHMDAIKLKSEIQLVQIPYDEQIYLQNGYLIGLAIRKFVKAYSQQYQDLLKIRQLASLQQTQNQNWQIIQPYLVRIGCNAITGYSDQEQQVDISPSQITEILQALFQYYGPKQSQKIRLKKKRNSFIDIYNFNPNKQPNQCQNSLQLFCIILVKVFNIHLNQALGLLVNKSKYLRKLIIQGSKNDQFESVKNFYQRLINLWPVFDEFSFGDVNQISKILQAVSEGIFSQQSDIVHNTLNLLSLVKNEQWFIKTGYYKLLCSNYIQCFYFTIQKLSPKYQQILNQDLHKNLTDKTQLFTLLNNLIKTLPKTIYSKEIFTHMPLSYFYQQCYSVLNPDEIDNYSPKVSMLALELLTKLIGTHPQRIPNSYISQIMQTYKFSQSRSYSSTYHVLALLFEILESLMNKQSPHTQKFFKLCMKYLSSTFGETRHWIIQNLNYLYSKMRKSFPLGCLLAMYSLDSIGQPDEYQLFNSIADDNINISMQQSTLALSYITKYIQTQLHCRCFLQILKKFINNHNKMTIDWGEQQCVTTVQKMHNINIPMLNQGQINILNPKPPMKNKVINSIGLKRKQMLKYRQYQLNKQLLEALIHIKDKKFLIHYINILSHAINNLQKQIGIKRRQLLNFFKKIRNKIKKQYDQVKQPETMKQLVKSIMGNKSSTSKNTFYEPQNMQSSALALTESKYFSDELSNSGRVAKNSIIYEQQQQQFDQVEQDNIKNNYKQFIINKFANQNVSSEKNMQGQQTAKMAEILKQFSQQPQPDQLIIINQQMLQQNEIAFINTNKQRYRNLMNYCQQVYRNYIQVFNNIGTANPNDITTILSNFGLLNMIQPKKFIQIQQKINKEYKHQLKQSQLVNLLLIQLGFHIFDFKKNRRIAITCISSLFGIMDQKLSKDNLQYRTMLTTSKGLHSSYGLTKKMVYQNKLSNNLFAKNNKNNKFFDCFHILSEIVQKSLGIGLSQPLSKQINDFNQIKATPNTIDVNITTSKSKLLSPSLQASPLGSAKFSYNSESKLKQKSELQYLQEQLQLLEDNRIQYDKVKYNRYRKQPIKPNYRANNKVVSFNSKTNKSKLLFQDSKQQQSKPKGLQNNLYESQKAKNGQNEQKVKISGKSPVNKYGDNKQLKNKLSNRLKILSRQIKINKGDSTTKYQRVDKNKQETQGNQVQKQVNKLDVMIDAEDQEFKQ